MPSSTITTDVAIVGDGLLGLCCARELARRGACVALIGERQRGASSSAAAGLLAPSLEPAPGIIGDFARSCRDHFPAFAEELAGTTGMAIPLVLSGILRIALDETEAEALRVQADGEATWVTSGEIRGLEPGLRPTLGGVFHPRDGGVDPRSLMAALDAILTGAVQRKPSLVRRLDLSGRLAVCELASGELVASEHVVLAAGAWAGGIPGMPRPIPVTPLRGQMAEYEGERVSRAVFGAGGYLVSRPGERLWVGTTAEDAGFDSANTEEGLSHLDGVLRRMVTGGAARTRAWAGLRPMSPDGHPIVGRDPEDPRVLYACGHSRNGVLMAPGTAALVADVAGGITGPLVESLSIARFDVSEQRTPVTGRVTLSE